MSTDGPSTKGIKPYGFPFFQHCTILFLNEPHKTLWYTKVEEEVFPLALIAKIYKAFCQFFLSQDQEETEVHLQCNHCHYMKNTHLAEMLTETPFQKKKKTNPKRLPEILTAVSCFEI